jgi:hypothetical protein
MKVSLAMLMKTNVEKMSENRPLAMLMKTNKLKSLSGDVDENKDSYRIEDLEFWIGDYANLCPGVAIMAPLGARRCGLHAAPFCLGAVEIWH